MYPLLTRPIIVEHALSAAIRKRQRQGLSRAAADAASLLNYHAGSETPPAWALDRLQRLPEVWAHHVRRRLGEPGEVTFALPEEEAQAA